MENALAEQREASPSISHPFNQLELVHVTLNQSVVLACFSVVFFRIISSGLQCRLTSLFPIFLLSGRYLKRSGSREERALSKSDEGTKGNATNQEGNGCEKHRAQQYSAGGEL